MVPSLEAEFSWGNLQLQVSMKTPLPSVMILSNTSCIFFSSKRVSIRRICCLTNLGTTPLVSLEAVMERERRPFSLGNIILLKEKGGMRESVPRQVDRKSKGPQRERGLEFSRRKKGQTFFFSPHSLGLYNNNVSCLRTVSGLRTVFGLNLLANSIILKCKLWE